MITPFFDSAYAAAERPVRMVDADPELFAGAQASTDLVVATVRLQPGPWSAKRDLASRAYALMVLDGVLARTISLGRQSRSELVGAGDVICPWDEGQPDVTLAAQVSWAVLEPARLALLDAAFFAAVARCPAASAALTRRGVQRANRIALQFAISDLRRIHDRLIALFLHLGDRWGRRTPDGIHVPLQLTHDLIAQLVGAQRPTVTSAVGDLQRSGRLLRAPDRTWVLSTRALEPAPSVA